MNNCPGGLYFSVQQICNHNYLVLQVKATVLKEQKVFQTGCVQESVKVSSASRSCLNWHADLYQNNSPSEGRNSQQLSNYIAFYCACVGNEFCAQKQALKVEMSRSP